MTASNCTTRASESAQPAGVNRRSRRFAFLAVVIGVLLPLALASPARAQSYGYSYLRITVERSAVSNFVHDEKYNGWLQIEAVRAEPGFQAARAAPGAASTGAASKTQKADDDAWTTLPAILHSGRGGAGKLRFGAGDEGGLDPLIDAQKRKITVPQADLDLYDEEKNVLIGKYKLKGIRILALEDVPASACPMYEITLSYLSIEKE
jgi:hypothetical protein